jgi:hypothetical protein
LSKALSFRVPSGVALYGGFNGTEVALSQRDINENPTILSGDLLSDDIPPFSNQTDNSFQVVRLLTGNGLTTLSGLTIASGRYTMASVQAAGVYLETGCNAVIDRCVFRYNQSTSVSAGAMGASVFSTSAVGSVQVRDSAFIQNRSLFGQGGAAWIDGAVKASFVNCRFIGNEGLLNGGALFCDHASQVTAVNCCFSGNEGGTFGSAIAVAGGLWGVSMAVQDCSFSRNRITASSAGGGAIGTFDGGTLSVTNCVMFENSSADVHAPANFYIFPGTTTSISTCCIFPFESAVVGSNLIFSDPMLVDPDGSDDIVGTEDDNLSLSESSPCIDAGNSLLTGSDLADVDADGDIGEPICIDIEGRPRLIDRPDVSNTGVGEVPIDIGAYEVSNWVNVGHGLEGAHGVPWLLGHGDWFSGEGMSIEVSNAKESSWAALVLGSSTATSPFKGGVLVPQPELAFLVRTSLAGSFELSGRAPIVTEPATVVLQVWVVDRAGPKGASATAGFMGSVVP